MRYLNEFETLQSSDELAEYNKMMEIESKEDEREHKLSCMVFGWANKLQGMLDQHPTDFLKDLHKKESHRDKVDFEEWVADKWGANMENWDEDTVEFQEV